MVQKLQMNKDNWCTNKKKSPRALLLQAKVIDHGEAPELQVSKIIKNYKDLTKCL